MGKIMAKYKVTGQAVVNFTEIVEADNVTQAEYIVENKFSVSLESSDYDISVYAERIKDNYEAVE
jgi:DNA-binding Lrp family transcriptional regulator